MSKKTQAVKAKLPSKAANAVKAAKAAKRKSDGKGKNNPSVVKVKKGMPVYDPSASYSCEDDSYIGRKKQVVVEFLALDLQVCDRCQGADKRVEAAVERCRDVLAACGYEIKLNTAVITNEWLAEQYRFYSSPTIRVNGVDICPSIEENDCKCCSDMSDSPVKCRLYPFNGTYYEVPPTDMVVQGIMNTVMQGKSARPEDKPYKLPNNLAQFFEGVRRKAADDAAEGEEGCCSPGCC